ncbi:MAG TPA: hypothetical protein VJH23_02270 [archaeon]|nr:hypothetical protein [archaeon]
MPARKRPFKGATQRDVFNTVHVGSEGEEWIVERARKFKDERHAVVNPRFGNPTIRYAVDYLEKHGIVVKAMKISQFIDEMESNGQCTANVSIDMPDPTGKGREDHFNFPKLFSHARNILLPGGIISITSENKSFLERLASEAAKHGVDSKPLPSPNTWAEMRTEYMRSRYRMGGQIYRMEFWLRKSKSAKK